MRGPRSSIAGLTIAAAMAAAGPAVAESVLRWASVGGAATFDPHAFDENANVAQLSQVYEGLVGLDSRRDGYCAAWRIVNDDVA